ncbi:MAG TPA: hypothetical protein VH500_06395 [Nitrososphaeraceae archaeon]
MYDQRLVHHGNAFGRGFIENPWHGSCGEFMKASEACLTSYSARDDL